MAAPPPREWPTNPRRSARTPGSPRVACTSAPTVCTAVRTLSGLVIAGMGGASGQGIGGMTKREPFPPPPENQHAATASRPFCARSSATCTYCCAKPCVPWRTRTDGNGPTPGGRAIAAIMTPTSRTATFTHCTLNASVPAGAVVADTTGGVAKPPRVVCDEASGNRPTLAVLEDLKVVLREIWDEPAVAPWTVAYITTVRASLRKRGGSWPAIVATSVEALPQTASPSTESCVLRRGDSLDQLSLIGEPSDF